MNRFVFALLLSVLPFGAFAKKDGIDRPIDQLSGRLEVRGDVLIYDTEKVNGDIRTDDIDRLKNALRDNAQIRVLRLNSGGGSVYAASEMAKIVMDHSLDTHVDGVCISACVDVFLAGQRRQMTIGSKIGFHQRSWDSDAVERYYHSWREDYDNATPFDFGSWIYGDTQAEVYEHLTYMISRGVEPGFAVKTLKTEASDEWYPTRLQLVAAGVLREEVPQD